MNDRTQRWELLPERPDEPNVGRVRDRLGNLPERVFASREAAQMWLNARAQPPAKVQPVFVFASGSLSVRRAGFGAENGSGWLLFDPDNARTEPNEARDGFYHVFDLAASEMVQLRDWLIQELPLVQPA